MAEGQWPNRMGADHELEAKTKFGRASIKDEKG